MGVLIEVGARCADRGSGCSRTTAHCRTTRTRADLTDQLAFAERRIANLSQAALTQFYEYTPPLGTASSDLSIRPAKTPCRSAESAAQVPS